MVERALREEGVRRRKVEAAADRGEWERFRRLRNLYFDSFYARLAAVHEANQSFPQQHRLPLRALPEIAERLDPVRGTEEAAVVRTEPKSSGEGFRVVTRFGVENKAIQIMAGRILRPALERHLAPNQYAVLNGGRPAACREVWDALEVGD